ncbi:uncharacterized protein LOC111384093 isoform X2 [Olea europaea var. sylvestris]|uniref:uncharacterized protein LOC111384093 isoform X2 n=1 Tax=Olea europaea var. sylvestris TaxID=158386 RepID=UPI000C1CFF7C|nr:uncharacterized protein LOC111384093 isoform X2 [Olea europaea var. sylvestris]
MQNSWWLYFCLLIFIIMLSFPVFTRGNVIDRKILHVGHELWKEALPLQMGSRLYELKGLKPHSWYEVKISYPASIPSSFSLQLKRGSSDLGLNMGRKLLNTEKLIFKTDGIDSLSDQGLHVLLNVESEGVVAIPGKQERKFVIFNIDA